MTTIEGKQDHFERGGRGVYSTTKQIPLKGNLSHGYWWHDVDEALADPNLREEAMAVLEQLEEGREVTFYSAHSSASVRKAA